MKNKFIKWLVAGLVVCSVNYCYIKSEYKKPVSQEVVDNNPIIITHIESESVSKNKPKVKVNDYYITDRVHVRSAQSISSDSIAIVNYGEKYKGVDFGEWVFIYPLNGFVKKEFCSTSLNKTTYNIQSKGFKSFMSYKAISSSSTQGKLQKMGYSVAGLRIVQGRYCVAIGTAFDADVGQYIDLILANGEVIPAIVGDIKADVDTDYKNITTKHNGCVSEFLVDTQQLSKKVADSGDISNAKSSWNSPVICIIVYSENALG